jgi:hypothetical protein
MRFLRVNEHKPQTRDLTLSVVARSYTSNVGALLSSNCLWSIYKKEFCFSMEFFVPTVGSEFLLDIYFVHFSSFCATSYWMPYEAILYSSNNLHRLQGGKRVVNESHISSDPEFHRVRFLRDLYPCVAIFMIHFWVNAFREGGPLSACWKAETSIGCQLSIAQNRDVGRQ